jgi:AraC-like DNA-binding protein
MAFVYRFPPGIGPGSGWLQLEPYFTLKRDTFFPHAHTFMELTLITQGKGRHRCAGQGQVTQAGDLIFCPPGLVHQFVDAEGQTHRNLHFDPQLLSGLRTAAPDLAALDDLFPDAGAPLRSLRLLPKELASAELALREIEVEQKEARPGKAAALRLLFQRYLLWLARLASDREAARQEGKRPASAGLAAARKLMQAHPNADHSLQSLAKAAGLSPSHFRRLFQLAYGDSPIQLLIRDRVRGACGPLESGELSVTEIAYQCGFKDGNYFTRQFKKVMGTSPVKYREMFRKA